MDVERQVCFLAYSWIRVFAGALAVRPRSGFEPNLISEETAR